MQKILPNGKTTTYFGELAEVDETGAWTDYLFLGSRRVATVDKTGTYYNVSDHLGSASLELDSGGAVVQKLDYMPFGSERVNVKTGSFDTRFTFTDQERDPESGLLYYGARYYHPVIGRFTQQDPVVRDNINRKEFALALANSQLLNAYSYVGNNPLKYVDREGEIPVLVILGIVAVGILWDNINPVLAPEVGYSSVAQPKTFAELAIPAYDNLPAYQKEFIRWSPIVLSMGRNKIVSFVDSKVQKGLTRNVFNVQTGNRVYSFITETSQLQSKFTKHAGVFGITGNQTKETLQQFESAILKHISDDNTQIIEGAYRQTEKVIHYVNPKTGINVMTNLDGTFKSAWKLTEKQMENIMKRGSL